MKKILITILSAIALLACFMPADSTFALESSIIEQNITVLVLNGTEISNETASPFQCIFETTNVLLSSIVDFKDCDGKVWLTTQIGNEEWINYSVTKHEGSNYSLNLNSSIFRTGENFSWQFYAEDCYNYTYNGSLNSFYVINNTFLGVVPVSPDGLNGWYVTEPVFSLNNDSIGEQLYYQWDSAGEGPILYTGPFGLENIPNPSNISAGILELNWWTDFGTCGNETKQSTIFKIDLTNPLIKNLQPPDGSIIYNEFKPKISAYLDEVYQSNSGINRGSIILLVDGIDVTSYADIKRVDDLDATISYIPSENLTLGVHNSTIKATDSAGRNSELTWFFYLNLTNPSFLIVYSPEDIVYGDGQVLFNITATEKVARLEYLNWNNNNPKWRILCKECYEYGNSKKKTQTLKEGENNITIRATDSFGQATEENISVFIDSKKPKISEIKPRTNAVINGSEFFIKYTEDNLQNITLFFNPKITLENCPAGKNQNCSTSADLSAYDGKWIDYWFEVGDAVRNVSSRKTRIFVDTTSPELKVNLPKDALYLRKVPFDITVSEEVILEYFDSNINSPKWRTLCTRCNEYGYSKEKTITFSKGSHDIIIRAVDKAGNSEEKEISFEVDY